MCGLRSWPLGCWQPWDPRGLVFSGERRRVLDLPKVGRWNWGQCPPGILEGLWITGGNLPIVKRRWQAHGLLCPRSKSVAQRILHSSLSAHKLSVQIYIAHVVQETLRWEMQSSSGQSCPMSAPQAWRAAPEDFSPKAWSFTWERPSPPGT